MNSQGIAVGDDFISSDVRMNRIKKAILGNSDDLYRVLEDEFGPSESRLSVFVDRWATPFLLGGAVYAIVWEVLRWNQ